MLGDLEGSIGVNADAAGAGRVSAASALVGYATLAGIAVAESLLLGLLLVRDLLAHADVALDAEVAVLGGLGAAGAASFLGRGARLTRLLSLEGVRHPGALSALVHIEAIVARLTVVAIETGVRKAVVDGVIGVAAQLGVPPVEVEWVARTIIILRALGFRLHENLGVRGVTLARGGMALFFILAVVGLNCGVDVGGLLDEDARGGALVVSEELLEGGAGGLGGEGHGGEAGDRKNDSADSHLLG